MIFTKPYCCYSMFTALKGLLIGSYFRVIVFNQNVQKPQLMFDIALKDLPFV